jgi:hypothetical protein
VVCEPAFRRRQRLRQVAFGSKHRRLDKGMKQADLDLAGLRSRGVVIEERTRLRHVSAVEKDDRLRLQVRMGDRSRVRDLGRIPERVVPLPEHRLVGNHVHEEHGLDLAIAAPSHEVEALEVDPPGLVLQVPRGEVVREVDQRPLERVSELVLACDGLRPLQQRQSLLVATAGVQHETLRVQRL